MTNLVARLRGGPASAQTIHRSTTQSFICSFAISWSDGVEHGRGELREVSATGLRIVIDQPLLAGRRVRLSPLLNEAQGLLPLEVALGVVTHSKGRRGRFEVGVLLDNPERISRFVWFRQLQSRRPMRTSPIPRIDFFSKPKDNQ